MNENTGFLWPVGPETNLVVGGDMRIHVQYHSLKNRVNEPCNQGEKSLHELWNDIWSLRRVRGLCLCSYNKCFKIKKA